ncbi:MAG: 2-dehydropantoate 2-reductase, partial [Bacillota bacterium]
MKIRTVSIIGLGALGILYGNHLSKRMPFANLRIIADQGRI